MQNAARASARDRKAGKASEVWQHVDVGSAELKPLDDARQFNVIQLTQQNQLVK